LRTSCGRPDRTASPVELLTDRHPDLDVADAYAIQKINID
jgi:hypothetical protein